MAVTMVTGVSLLRRTADSTSMPLRRGRYHVDATSIRAANSCVSPDRVGRLRPKPPQSHPGADRSPDIDAVGVVFDNKHTFS